MTDDSAGRVDTHEFTRADGLIAALRPESPLWAPDPSEWIFRGHADAEWKLLPSVNRRTALARFMSSAPTLPGGTLYCTPRIGDVLKLLRDFAEMLNAAGRPVPGPPGVRSFLQKGNVFTYPPTEEVFHQLAALGQHHGLPTLLLDWTRVGTYAAYFAASDEAGLPDDSGNLEVWALNARSLQFGGLIGDLPVVVHVVRPALAGNPNLHSQGGVFTLTVPPINVHDEKAMLSCVTVDDAVTAVATSSIASTKLRRLSLPRREANEVLKRLEYERVAGMMLFPGLDGVVRSVRDHRHRR